MRSEIHFTTTGDLAIVSFGETKAKCPHCGHEQEIPEANLETPAAEKRGYGRRRCVACRVYCGVTTCMYGDMQMFSLKPEDFHPRPVGEPEAEQPTSGKDDYEWIVDVGESIPLVSPNPTDLLIEHRIKSQ